jgi:hypothetical protein
MVILFRLLTLFDSFLSRPNRHEESKRFHRQAFDAKLDRRIETAMTNRRFRTHKQESCRTAVGLNPASILFEE